MQASTSREGLADYDLFRCLSCEATISRSPAAGKKER
jgi:hypothetical protein